MEGVARKPPLQRLHRPFTSIQQRFRGMQETPLRKLAVILHADVVGSTSLVHADERIVHEQVQAAFRRFLEVVDTYGGIAHEILLTHQPQYPHCGWSVGHATQQRRSGMGKDRPSRPRYSDRVSGQRLPISRRKGRFSRRPKRPDFCFQSQQARKRAMRIWPWGPALLNLALDGELPGRDSVRTETADAAPGLPLLRRSGMPSPVIPAEPLLARITDLPSSNGRPQISDGSAWRSLLVTACMPAESQTIPTPRISVALRPSRPLRCPPSRRWLIRGNFARGESLPSQAAYQEY